MPVAITGGSGFIGTHLSKRLVDAGEKVRILDIRKPAKSHPAYSSFQKCDIRSQKQLARGLKGCTHVFHLAALIDVQASIRNPIADFETNAIGTLNVLSAAEELGAQRLVYTSSAAIYGMPRSLPIGETHQAKPISPYGNSKLWGERCAAVFSSSDLEAVSLRLFNVFGPGQNPKNSYAGVITKFSELLRKNKSPVIYGNGKQTRDFVYVQDVVSALMLASKAKKASGEAINIGTGKETSLLELAKTMAAILRKDAEPVHAPARKGEITRSVADIGKAKRLLGFRPKFSLKAGLSEFLT